MLSNDVDFDPYRTRLALRSRVQIPGFLQEAAASRLHQCLREDVPWSLAERLDGKPRTIAHADYAAMSQDERAARLRRAYDQAATEFQFAYDSYMMVQAAKQGRDPGLLLHLVLDFLNSPDFLAFARWLTDEPGIKAASAQATRYRQGQFLLRHEDKESNEDRAFAYVINLTRRWQADWGGLLHFHGEQDAIIETFVPFWNSLSVFRVPQSHSVSLVAPWAAEERLAITGWLLRG